MFDTFNPAFERKATKTELVQAQEVYNHLTTIGLKATYAGGKKSKGQGFWVVGHGYLSCADCLKLTSSKIVAFTSETGRALMGEVTDDTGSAYVVKVTSTESKKDKNLVGWSYFVSKENAKVIN